MREPNFISGCVTNIKVENILKELLEGQGDLNNELKKNGNYIDYNTFYQGGGVIFYQPDLERYEAEVGPLIPQDDEYIGPRIYEMDALKEEINRVIKDGRIDLSSLRRKEYRDNYDSINEHHDAKNIERIAKRLKKSGVI